MNEIICPNCGTDIDEHEAGQCLDEWVATVIMQEPKPIYDYPWEQALFESSRSWWGNWTWRAVYSEGDVAGWSPRSFSTQIEAAWRVLERFRFFDINYDESENEALLYWVEIVHNCARVYEAQAKTPPLAICRAAIKATILSQVLESPCAS